MMGLCRRCLSSNVSVKLIDGSCYCPNCARNKMDEELNNNGGRNV